LRSETAGSAESVGVTPDGSVIQTEQGNLTVPDGTLRLDA